MLTTTVLQRYRPLSFMVETASRQFARVPKIMHTVGAQGRTRKLIYHCSKGQTIQEREAQNWWALLQQM